ncbi:MAG: carboxymuconolactone decarboxylase family protein [Bacteroidetes bacterium]|nr:carboxymuconolactone decarboxylase family protein [Bacteroidota bacterium]
MKDKQYFLKWIFFLAIILNANNMNAQTNNSLSPQEQGLAAISALTATGDLDNLKIQLNTALDVGVTINEIKEALVQLYAYVGFPRSLNALNMYKTVLDERKGKGRSDVEGKTIFVENKVADKYEQGRKVIEELTGNPQAKPAPGFGEFSPRIDTFLKEHLFADIFASDVLNYKQRELVTISALASVPGLEPQLQSHINMGMNTGITAEQINSIFDAIEKVISKEQAEKARTIFNKLKK